MSEERERELRAKVEIVSKWKELREHKAFKEFMTIAGEQVTQRVNEVMLTPLENLFEAGKQEFMKGEIAGIKLFMQIPETVVGNLEADIALIREELENESIAE